MSKYAADEHCELYLEWDIEQAVNPVLLLPAGVYASLLSMRNISEGSIHPWIHILHQFNPSSRHFSIRATMNVQAEVLRFYKKLDKFISNNPMGFSSADLLKTLKWVPVSLDILRKTRIVKRLSISLDISPNLRPVEQIL